MTAARVIERERIVRPREHLIASRLRRFAWRHREAVSVLTRRHPRLADLALSFPALLFALAVPRPRFDPEPVIERVIAGAPLGELAAETDLPMWTRKLMPEAFLYSVPRLPDGELFRRQIPNHLPQHAKEAHRWLTLITNTAFWGDEAISLWFARHADMPEHGRAIAEWRLICLWAWHSSHPSLLAARYLDTKWTPDMAPKQARDAAHEWSASIEAAAYLGEKQVSASWANAVTIDGHAFEPILDAGQLISTARFMRNCIRNYSSCMANNEATLWLVRKGAEPVAMVSLSAYGNQRFPRLGEVSGPANKPVADDLLLAVHRWYRSHVPPEQVVRFNGREAGQANWTSLWRDYWVAKRCVPTWLPRRPRLLELNLPTDPDWAPRLRRRRCRRPHRRRRAA